MTTALVQIEPGLSSLWTAHLGIPVSKVDVLGEGVLRFETDEPLSAERLWRSVFPRLAVEVIAEFRIDARAHSNEAYVEEALRACRPHLRDGCFVIGLKWWLRRRAEALRVALRRESLARDDEARPGGAALLLAVAEDRVILGRALSSKPLLPKERYPVPFVPMPKEGQASRARGKLREGFFRLAELGALVEGGGEWIELGAAPGGMTEELLAAGHRVLAIDKAPLAPHLLADARVTFLRGDARDATIPEREYAGIVCDMNARPPIPLECTLGALRHLRPAAPVFFTLKLDEWANWQSASAHAIAAFAREGVEILETRHLFHNRQELTLLGVRRDQGMSRANPAPIPNERES